MSRVVWLAAMLLGLLISGCSVLPPSRSCPSLPPGSFVSFPAGWSAPVGTEQMPAVDNAGIALAARLSYLAYRPDEEIRTLGEVEIGEIGIDPNGEFPHLFGTKYFIWRDTGGASGPRNYLVVRGTWDVENIFQDIDYPKILDPDLGIWVHRGYYGIAREILDRLRARQPASQEPLWITGHSLGGGVALILYLHLHHDGATLGPLYTFGQPRTVAEDAWERYQCLPIVRVANYGDFVPLVPPTKKERSCDHPLDPGCHGTFIQLGDEVVLTKGGACEYRIYHDPNALGFDVVRTLLEDAQHKELKKYLSIHLQESYYERTRPLADNPGLACTFHPRP